MGRSTFETGLGVIRNQRSGRRQEVLANSCNLAQTEDRRKKILREEGQRRQRRDLCRKSGTPKKSLLTNSELFNQFIAKGKRDFDGENISARSIGASRLRAHSRCRSEKGRDVRGRSRGGVGSLRSWLDTLRGKRS